MSESIPAHPPIRRRQSAALLNTVLWVAVVVTTLAILSAGKNFFIPLVLAGLAVYLMKTLVRFVSGWTVGGRRIPEPVAVLLSFVVVCAFTWGLFSIVAANALSVADAAPRYQARFVQLERQLVSQAGLKGSEALVRFVREIEFGSILATLATGLGGLLGKTSLVVLYVVFLLLEIRFVPRKLEAIFPEEERRAAISGVLERIDHDVQTYLGVKTLVSLFTAVLSYLVMRLVGLDFAEFWALCIFILNFIPTIGSIVATVLPALLALLQFDTLAPFVIVTVGITAIQQFFGSFVDPTLMGHSLNLSPLVVIMSLVLWGSLWGIVGMFLCVPITVILMIVLSNFERTRWVAILLSKNGKVTPT